MWGKGGGGLHASAMMSTIMYFALVLMINHVCTKKRRIKKTREYCRGSIVSYSEMNGVNRSTYSGRRLRHHNLANTATGSYYP